METKETVVYDSDMQSAELDEIKLNSKQRTKGIIRLIVCSLIGILVFFVSC